LFIRGYDCCDVNQSGEQNRPSGSQNRITVLFDSDQGVRIVDNGVVIAAAAVTAMSWLLLFAHL